MDAVRSCPQFDALLDDLPPSIAARLDATFEQAPPSLVVPGLDALITSATHAPSLLSALRIELDDPDHRDAWSVLPTGAPTGDAPALAPVALYAARELTLTPGARLRVDGDPAVLFVERLTIVEGAALELFVRARIAIGTLEKVGAERGGRS